MLDDDPRQHHHRSPRSGEDHRDPPSHLPAPAQRAVGHRGERVRHARHRRGDPGHGGRALQRRRRRFLKGDGGVIIREVAGGCLCCAVAAPFTVAVTQLLRRAKPDRLIIEPSGLGHPGRVHDAHRRTPGEGPAHRRDDRARRHDASGARGAGGVRGVRGSGQLRGRRRGAKGDVAIRRRSVPATDWAQTLYPPRSPCTSSREGTGGGRPDTPLDEGDGVMCKPAPMSSHAHAATDLAARLAAKLNATGTQPAATNAPGGDESRAGNLEAGPLASSAAPRSSPRLGCCFTGTTSDRASLARGFESLAGEAKVVRFKGVVRVGATESVAPFGTPRPGPCVWTRWRGGATAGSRSSWKERAGGGGYAKGGRFVDGSTDGEEATAEGGEDHPGEEEDHPGEEEDEEAGEEDGHLEEAGEEDGHLEGIEEEDEEGYGSDGRDGCLADARSFRRRRGPAAARRDGTRSRRRSSPRSNPTSSRRRNPQTRRESRAWRTRERLALLLTSLCSNKHRCSSNRNPTRKIFIHHDRVARR